MKGWLIFYMRFSRPPVVSWASPTRLSVPHRGDVDGQRRGTDAGTLDLGQQQYQGVPRPLWAPNYYQKVEELSFGAAPPSFSGFSLWWQLPVWFRSIPGLSVDVTELDSENDGVRRAWIHVTWIWVHIPTSPLTYCVNLDTLLCLSKPQFLHP